MGIHKLEVLPDPLKTPTPKETQAFAGSIEYLELLPTIAELLVINVRPPTYRLTLIVHSIVNQIILHGGNDVQTKHH